MLSPITRSEGETRASIGGWPVRGAVFVVAGVLLFAATIGGVALPDATGPRGRIEVVPALGLLVAGPLAMIVSSFAVAGTRLRVVVPFALGMTALCYVVFKYALRLPIPVLPPLLGY